MVRPESQRRQRFSSILRRAWRYRVLIEAESHESRVRQEIRYYNELPTGLWGRMWVQPPHRLPLRVWRRLSKEKWPACFEADAMQALHSHFTPGNASTLIRRRLSAGWVRIRLKMTASRPDRFRLFADEGEGFRPENCLLNLEVAGAVDFDGFVHVAFPVSALQFDPPIESGEFQLESLRGSSR